MQLLAELDEKDTLYIKKVSDGKKSLIDFKKRLLSLFPGLKKDNGIWTGPFKDAYIDEMTNPYTHIYGLYILLLEILIT